MSFEATKSMRDPKRIPIMLEALRKAWERNPDARLGQLVHIAGNRMEPMSIDHFYTEDDEMLTALWWLENR